ncbi:polysaccharide pyruvyl transferase family protein [Sandaracinus amylolyticus]|uniref:polysaccharide pyruvyl transferase family protein n=1 Tax=Sandaracinus amylolyticus TaxID=927083 RepID=UPI001F3B86C5|nr:polysaccharide pyruvyl transferase family protein [Sandaracinus amylolyticus]UJR81048.1 Polysaccharide pyruvyl transferase family protein WcaK [Sandaracinus amylolyticus]
MGLSSKLFAQLAGRAAKAAAKRTKEALDPDRLLQLTMEGLVETARERHESEPSPRWRPGEPIKLLFAGYVGTRNTGADVRVEEMLRQFRHLFGDEHCDLSILTIDPSKTRGYFKTVKQVHVPQIFPKFLFDQVRAQHGVIACEGSMFKSKFASALTTMMAGALGLAVAEEKIAVGYGGEAGAMDASLEDMIRRTLGERALVLTRNDESSAILERLGVPTRVGTDTAWTYEGAPDELAEKLLRRAGWDEKKPVVVVCPIHPFWWPVKPDPLRAAVHGLTGAYEKSHFESIYFHEDGPEVDARFDRYIAGLAGALDDFRRAHDVFPVIVGMEALDRTACEALSKKLARRGAPAMFVSDEHEYREIVAVLRRASLIVSSRYHALVCSMPAAVPSVGVTMDERIRNLMRDRGQRDLLLNVDDEALDERLFEAMQRAWSDPDASRVAIERSVARSLVRQGEMGVHLVDHVRAHHPRFPFARHLGSSETGGDGDPIAHLPPLAARQRLILERWRAVELGALQA